MAVIEQLRQISAADLAALGVQQVAYVRLKQHRAGTIFAIHAADGTELATVPNLVAAVALIRQNDLEPVSLH